MAAEMERAKLDDEMLLAEMADTSDPSTQVDLLERIRSARDDEAWHRFVKRYVPLIQRYARQRGLQEADVWEVIQGVLISVSRSIHKFDYDASKGRFRSWLGVATCREIQRVLAKTRRKGLAAGGGCQDELINGIDAGLDPAWCDEFHDNLFRCALCQTQCAFDEATWRVFELTWILDRSASEAAREVDKPLGWVYKAKFRVLRHLKEVLSGLSADAPLPIQ